MKFRNEHNLPPILKDIILSLLNGKVSVYQRQAYYARLKDIQDNVNEAITLYETELNKAEKKQR